MKHRSTAQQILGMTMALALLTLLSNCGIPNSPPNATEIWQTEEAVSSTLSRMDGLCDGWAYNYREEVLFDDDIVKNLLGVTPCSGYEPSDSKALLYWGLTTVLSLGPKKPNETVSIRIEQTFTPETLDTWSREVAAQLGDQVSSESVYVEGQTLYAKMTPEQAEAMVGQEWPADPPKIPRDLFVKVDPAAQED